MNIVALITFLIIGISLGGETLVLKEGVRRATSPPPILFYYKDMILRIIPSMSFIEIWDRLQLKEIDRKFMGKRIRTALLRKNKLIVVYYDGKGEAYELPSWRKINTFKGLNIKVIKSLMNSCNSCIDYHEGKLFYVSEEGIIIMEGKERSILKGDFNGIRVNGKYLIAGGNEEIVFFDLKSLKREKVLRLKGEVLFLDAFGNYTVADTTEGLFLIKGESLKELTRKDFSFIGKAFKYIRFPVYIMDNLILYPHIAGFGKFILGTEYYIKIYDLERDKLLCNHKVLMNDSAGFISDGIIYDKNSFLYTRIDAEFLKVNCGGMK